MYSRLPDQIVGLFSYHNDVYSLFSILLSLSPKSSPDVTLRRTR